MKSPRKFTKELKQTAVRRLESGGSVAEVARALEVHPSDLHRWRRERQEYGGRAFSGMGIPAGRELRGLELPAIRGSVK
jgi:transposase-like protein